MTSKTLSLNSKVSWPTTSIVGLIAWRWSTADAIFERPTSAVVCRIWRCRFVTSTVSKSTMPSFPIPAAARYSATGEPSPPAPITRTLASSSLRCPFPPMFGRMMWREYRWT